MAELIGRKAELDRIESALDGPGGLFLISGEAGVGKTRLADEAGRRGRSRGRQVIWGRPEQVTTPGPFALIADAAQSIADACPDVLPEATTLLSALKEPVSGVFGTAPFVRQIAARLRGLMSNLGPRPIGVFEDLHAADSSSQAVVVHLARSAVDDGYLFLGTIRPEEVIEADNLARLLSVLHRERIVSEIDLAPLSREECVDLARALLPDAGNTKESLDAIADLSEGIPFFVEELAASQPLGVGTVPNSVDLVVRARLQHLAAKEREIVQGASLMLGSLDVDVLASTFDCDRSEINNALGSGIKAGIVSARNEIVTFRHALVRESVRLSFPSVEAEELHKRLASAIESVHVDDLSVAARSLAHHWYMGHDKERARRWALAAGEFALALNALADARGAFELAIACSPLSNSPDALKGIAEVEIREDRLNEAHALLQRAVVGFKEANQHNHVASVLARLAWVRTILHSPGAVEALDEALQMVPRENRDLQRATLLAQKGQMFIHSLDRISEGETILAEAATQAAENKVYSVKAECLDGLAWAAEYNYRPAEADRRSAEARSAAILSGKPETIGRTHNNSAILLIIHGHHLEALEILDTARESLRKSFGFGGVKVVDFTEATARWRMGDPGRVDALIARQEASWPHFRGYRWILQSWSAAHLDDRQRALHTVAACWRDVGVTDIEASVDELSTEAAEALICDLLVKLESGDRDSLALAERLLEFYQSGTADEVLLAKALAARAAIISGDVVSSLRFVDEIEDELRRYSSPYFDGMAKEARGYLALEAGKADVAFDSFMAAAMTFEGCSNLVDRARSLRRAGMALSTSHEREAVKLMRTALEIATECGSTLEVRRTESALRSLGVRPRAGRPRKKAQASEGLSAREEEVAVLVAAGATNAEIASRLFLSERTVQDHITHALRKLGASGRAGLAAWAAKAGLF